MAGAYPGLNIVTDDDRLRMRERMASTFEDPSTTIYGLNRNGLLVAGMILYDFTMNVRGSMLPAGGLGSLAVDLMHRKRKAAKAMVSFYLEHYRQKGVALALLYPFRTDFYRRMGFGYGTKMNQYVFSPHHLRTQASDRAHIEYLGIGDVDRVLACFNSYAARTHGMIAGSRWRVKQMLSNPAIRTAGFVEKGQVLGYVAFDFERQGHFLKNDLRIKQMMYQDSAVLAELLAFLRSLADQFEWIVFNTQEGQFHHLLDDPRSRNSELIPSVYHESNSQGVGLMYRAIDLAMLLDQASGFNCGSSSITLHIKLEDTFIPNNSRSQLARFQDGRATLLQDGECDAEIRMDVSDFASMFMGAISLEQLVDYGLAQVSQPDQVGQISELFATDLEPICMTAF
jgi:predicted acetyltransferase